MANKSTISLSHVRIRVLQYNIRIIIKAYAGEWVQWYGFFVKINKNKNKTKQNDIRFVFEYFSLCFQKRIINFIARVYSPVVIRVQNIYITQQYCKHEFQLRPYHNTGSRNYPLSFTKTFPQPFCKIFLVRFVREFFT